MDARALQAPEPEVGHWTNNVGGLPALEVAYLQWVLVDRCPTNLVARLVTTKSVGPTSQPSS